MILNLSFGALAPPIREQLRYAKVTIRSRDLAHFQRDADAVTRLVVRGLLSDGIAQKAIRKLMRNILAKARPDGR